MQFLQWLRLLGDSARIRTLRLLAREELSVAELQEILGMGQSRISMQLTPMRQAGLVDVRKSGQKSLYRFTPPPGAEALLAELLGRAAADIPETERDDEALALVLARRKDRLRAYFDELAGKFGRSYVPGRSWKALAETLLRLLPPLVIADLGAGEGTLALMLAQTAEWVIAVDSSPKMVEYGRGVAAGNGIANLEYRLGDMEALPIDDSSVDLAVLHQSLHHALHPERAVAEAHRILRLGGRIVILDLLKHDVEAVRSLYGDEWLGFSRAGLSSLLRGAGFEAIEIAVLDRAEESPRFESLMGIGTRAA